MKYTIPTVTLLAAVVSGTGLASDAWWPANVMHSDGVIQRTLDAAWTNAVGVDGVTRATRRLDAWGGATARRREVQRLQELARQRQQWRERNALKQLRKKRSKP